MIINKKNILTDEHKQKGFEKIFTDDNRFLR